MKTLFFEPGRDFPVMLAPMAGVTDAVFRGICRAFGADFSFTEMVSAKGMHYNNKNTGALLETDEREPCFGVQLFGSEPDILAEAAHTLCMSDIKGLALIDINMGCPAQKIVKNGEGSALMKNEALAGALIEAVVRASSVPVSVKFRKGFDGEHINAVSFAKTAQNAGASMLTVHGRTREQLYSGRADREIIAQVKNAVHIPVIGNGDVFTAADALELRAQTGCDGVMVARGAQGNPFIFAQIKAALSGEPVSTPTPHERLEMAREHIRRLVEARGDGAVRELRKHVAWYTQGLRAAAELRASVNAAQSSARMLELLEEYEAKALS